MDVLFVVTAAAFALLCALAVRRGIAYRHASSTWLAVAFAAIAVAGAMAPQLDGATSTAGQFVGLVAVALGLLVHPVALVMFAHGLQPVDRRWRVATVVLAAALLVGVVVVGVTDPGAFADDGPPSLAGSALLVAVSLAWLGIGAVVGARLFGLAGRLTSSIGRARARMMGAGVLSLAPAVAVPFLVPGLTESTGVFFALWACALTWMGYAPPRGLRAAWARADTRRLTEIELATLRDPGTALEPWLDAVRAVWDADAAWLEADGHVVAGSGTVPATALDLRWDGDGVRVETHDPGGWLLAARATDGVLVVRTELDPLLFGDDESELFLATAGRLGSTLARRDLEQRDRDEHARRLSALHQDATVQLRDDVLSTLSHELRTPLVTLRGVPELLLRRWSSMDADQLAELLQRMHGNALTLHRLVESTLLLAALRAGEQRLHVEVATIGQVVDAALDRLDRLGVAVDRVRVIGDERVALSTDVRHAAAVVSELVHNALTYSDAPAPVDVEARVDGHDVELRVVDRGRGVASGDRDGMLHAFGRAGDVLHRDRRGLGIGLTLVSELLPHLQAELDVRPIVDGGTLVSLRLPAAAVGGIPTPVPIGHAAG